MAEGIFEGREILTSRLHRLLGTLVNSVEIAGQNNLSSSHVVAETTMAGLLNRVYGWELVNANTIRQNYPGVDLIDTERNIAVQVTATRTTEKVRHTLEEAGKSGRIYKKLIVLILTNSKPTEGMYTCTVPTYSGPVTIWNIPDVFRDARELEPVKLAELTRFMEAEVGSIRERVKDLPHLELPPSSALQATGFVGREPELAEIQSRFARGDRMVVLTGLGGMGKTELAAKYGRDYPGLVYFVRFDTSFRRTLANMSLGIRPKLTEEDLRLEEGILIKKVLTLLERSSSEDLLIIDNADSETGALADLMKEPGYKLIQALPLRLLVTTRSESPRAIRVARMPDDPLFEIFRNHGAALSEDEMRKLIRAVNGHTLTVDLIARTLADNWVPVSAPEMLDAITEATLREEDFPEVGTDYNGDLEQLHIYQRLRGVFQVAKIPPTEQQLLRLATLLPDGGMDVRLFRKALPSELLKVFPGLGRRGWLSADHQMLTIHPVIRLVCRTEQPLTEADCEAFLSKLWEQYDETQYRPDQYEQMAELFTTAYDRMGNAHWLNCSGILLNEIAQHQKLHDMYHARLPKLEQVLPSNSAALARAYQLYGNSFADLGHYTIALTYYEKALLIQQSDLSTEHPLLAPTYNSIGVTYIDLGKTQKGLEYMQIALDIHKKSLPPEHPTLASSYDNIGCAYSELGNLLKALEYHQIALDIRKKALPPEHPDLAVSYDNIGCTYGELGNHPKALEYHQIALDIRKKSLSPEHPDLAVSYGNIASTHGSLGNHRKALEYHKIALNIREKALPPEHPNLATSYLGIGISYSDLGLHHVGLACELKSLEILEQSLPPEHPNLAKCLHTIAITHLRLRNAIQAALHMRRAAKIIAQSDLPENHPDRVNYPKLADTFEKKADIQRRILLQPLRRNRFPFGKK